MTWSPIPPRRYSAQSPAAPMVTAAIGLGRQDGKAAVPRLILVFRPAAIQPTPPAWLRAGERVNVMAGHGEHRGMVRIEPGADYALGRQGGKRLPTNTIATLFVPLPATLAHIARSSAVAEMDWQDGWIEVTLPRAWWHDPEARPAEPAATPPFSPAIPTQPRSPAAHARRVA